MKRTWTILLAVCLLLTLLPVASLAAGSAISDVWVETHVTPIGQKVKNFYLTVEDPALLEGLTVEDFSMQGLATAWNRKEPFSFDAILSGISVNEDVLTIGVAFMDPKYFYVDSYNVTCTNARLSFTSEDISKVTTLVADEFEKVRAADGAEFDYNFFAPENAEGPLPLVLVCHGGGDYLNLQQNRLVLAFAEKMNQQRHPCYVLAPLFGNPDSAVELTTEEILAKSVEFITKMIEEGKVDGNRVYVTGKSMGGGNTMTAITTYPEFFAAALPCATALFEDPQTYDISPILDMPIYIVQNEGDPRASQYGRIPEYMEIIYNRLVEAGNDEAYFHNYTTQSMDVYGVYNYHDVEVQVTNDLYFYDWLFAQVKD